MNKEEEINNEIHEILEEIDDPYDYAWTCDCGGISISIDGTYTKESMRILAECLLKLAE